MPISFILFLSLTEASYEWFAYIAVPLIRKDNRARSLGFEADGAIHTVDYMRRGALLARENARPLAAQLNSTGIMRITTE